MAFDVTNASKHVEAKSEEIIVSGLIGGSATAKALIDSSNVQFGVKGETAILKMDIDVNIQDNSACAGRSPLGDVRLSDAKIVVTPLKDTKNLCVKTIYNTYHAFQALNAGSYNGTELNEAFAEKIMNERAKAIASVNEKMLWQGDKASTTNALNMRRINGVLKQITAATAATGADIVAKLQGVVTATNIDLLQHDDFYIFMGQDTFNAYKMALAGKNIFQHVEDNMLFGTTAKIMVVPGLNGSSTVVASRLSNLQLGLDLQSDFDQAKLKYDESSEQYFQDFYYALGIAVVYPAEAKAYTV